MVSSHMGILLSESPVRFGPSNAVISFEFQLSRVIYNLFQSNCFFILVLLVFISRAMFGLFPHLYSLGITCYQFPGNSDRQTKLEMDAEPCLPVSVNLHGYHQSGSLLFMVVEVFQR